METDDLILTLIPDREERRSISSTIDEISEFMRERTDLSIKRTFPAGSFEKKTMLTGRGEVDLVFYLEPQTAQNWEGSDFRRELRVVLHKAQQILSGSKHHRRKFRAVSLKINGVEADILLGLENVTPMTMKQQKSSIKSYVRPSVANYQVEWWRERGGNYHDKLNNLVRLGKYWLRARAGNKKICSSYPLEMMIVHACEEHLVEESYDELFERFINWVLETELDGRFFFTKYYQEKDLVNYPNNSLNLYDPADPTNNLATKYSGLGNKRRQVFLEYAKETKRKIDNRINIF